jgi:hypothetical protein
MKERRQREQQESQQFMRKLKHLQHEKKLHEKDVFIPLFFSVLNLDILSFPADEREGAQTGEAAERKVSL